LADLIGVFGFAGIYAWRIGCP